MQKLKEDAQKKMEKECPFQPQKKKIEKYLVGGNMMKRNEVWYFLSDIGSIKNVERKSSGNSL